MSKKPSHTVNKIFHAASRAEERYGIKNIFSIETAIRVIMSNDDRTKYIYFGDSKYIFKIGNKEYCIVYERKSQCLVTFLPPKKLGTLKEPNYKNHASGNVAKKYNQYIKLNSCLEPLKQKIEEKKKNDFKSFDEVNHAFCSAKNYMKKNKHSSTLIEEIIFQSIIQKKNVYAYSKAELLDMQSEYDKMYSEVKFLEKELYPLTNSF